MHLSLSYEFKSHDQKKKSVRISEYLIHTGKSIFNQTCKSYGQFQKSQCMETVS
jgi:hypothetical protein